MSLWFVVKGVWSENRDFDELCFRRKTALALCELRKPDITIEVKHWRENMSRCKAICRIKCQAFTKDRGSAVVSFMHGNDI